MTATPADLEPFLGVEPEASLFDAASDAFGGRIAEAQAGVLGALAGTLASLAAVVIGWLLARYAFEFSWNPTPWVPLAGALAMFNIPVAQFPDIVPPVVQVTARYPGASAGVVESTVAQPIESAVNGADRMLYMRSNSGNDGSYTLAVTFALGTNPDINTVNVNNRVKQAEPRLPLEVRRQGVSVEKGSSSFLQVIAFSSPDGSRDDLFISNYVTLNILDSLKRVPGTTNVQIFGAKDYAMRIWLDPDKLAGYRLTVQDVEDALRRQNLEVPAGRIESQQREFNVTAQSIFSSVGQATFDSGKQLPLHQLLKVAVRACCAALPFFTDRWSCAIFLA